MSVLRVVSKACFTKMSKLTWSAQQCREPIKGAGSTAPPPSTTLIIAFDTLAKLQVRIMHTMTVVAFIATIKRRIASSPADCRQTLPYGHHAWPPIILPQFVSSGPSPTAPSPLKKATISCGLNVHRTLANGGLTLPPPAGMRIPRRRSWSKPCAPSAPLLNCKAHPQPQAQAARPVARPKSKVCDGQQDDAPSSARPSAT